jgi:hypothetical protein
MLAEVSPMFWAKQQHDNSFRYGAITPSDDFSFRRSLLLPVDDGDRNTHSCSLFAIGLTARAISHLPPAGLRPAGAYYQQAIHSRSLRLPPPDLLSAGVFFQLT